MKTRLICASAMAIALATTAHAQVSTGPATANPPAGTVEKASAPPAAIDASPDEIVVTARKRAESVQDVPLSVAVISGSTLQQRAVTTFDSLPSLASGVTIQRGANNVASFFIRGLGTGPGSDAFEQSVALFIDGSYAGRQAEYNQPLFDTERVEIIKGTQASLLAKGTSLGAISVTTRRPGRDWHVDALGSYELALGSYLFEGGVDVPFSDTLNVRFAGQSNQQHGAVKNEITGHKVQRINSLTGRITAVWRPTDKLDATLMYQQYRVTATGANEEYILDLLGLARARAVAAGYNAFETNLDRDTASSDALINETIDRNTGHRAVGTINYELGDYTLTSVSAYSDFRQDRRFDIDVLPGSYVGADPLANGNHQYTQEARISSPSDRPLNFVAGLFFLKETWFYDRSSYSRRGPAGAPTQSTLGAFTENFKLRTTNYSAFAQANYNITDAFSASVGLRGTAQRRRASFFRVATEPGLYSSFLYPPIAPSSTGFHESNLDGSAGLQYKFGRAALFYVSYSRGTKGGGYFNSPTSVAVARFKPETANTIEAGTKLTFGRSLFNVALFHTKVSDYQNYLFNGVSYDSPPLDLKAKGVEVEGAYQIAPTLRLSGAVTYLSADRGIDIINRFNDHARPTNAPRWSGTTDIAYSVPVSSDLRFGADAGIQFKSSVFYNTPAATLGVGPVVTTAIVPKGPSYALFNARLSLGARDGSWELAVVGRNLTDRTYLAYARQASLIGGAALGTANMPRTVALQLSVHH